MHAIVSRLLAVGLFWLPALFMSHTARCADEPVRQVEGISEYRLGNGLQVLLMPDAGRPTFTINITYFVGSKHEGYGETGMAHLLEHMLFYGTPDHPDINREISERGGKANGTTWYDRTNYFQTMPAGGDNLQWALEMEADRMVNAVIDGADLESEMTVVRNEYEMGETDPLRVLMQRVMSVAYDWHGYGRSTIGARADIENVPLERLRHFYRRHYRPDNAMLVLSGNFEPAVALASIRDTFGRLVAPERSGAMRLWPTYTREQAQDGPRRVTVNRTGNVQSIMAAWHVPAATHSDYPAVEVLARVLGDEPAGRLYKALVEAELASRVSAFSLRLAEPGALVAYAQVDRGRDLDAVEEVMLETVANLAAEPPTEEEVNRAVNALSRDIELTLNDSERVGIGLTEWAAAGDWRLMFLHRDRVESVTAGDVAAVAEAYLKPGNRSIGRYEPVAEPDRAEIPTAPEAGELLAGYTGRPERAAGEDFERTPANLAGRMVRFELANGADVALLPIETRGNSVHGRLAMRYGTLGSMRGRAHVGGVVPDMLYRGTENYSRQEISDRLDALRASLNLGGGGTMLAGSLETTGENLPALLDLLAELLKRPVFPAHEWDKLRRRTLTGIDRQRDQPGPVASRALTRYLQDFSPDHPAYTPSFEEAVARLEVIDRQALVDFHADFYGFGPGTDLTLVGDFDPAAVRAQLETLFAGWTTPAEYARIPHAAPNVGGARLERQLADKANAVLVGRQPLVITDRHPDYAALMLGAHMIGGGFLSSRLSDRIRKAEGISYSIGAGVNAHPVDERGSFGVFAMYNPENRKRLHAALREELEKVLDEGFTAEELESAKRGWLQQQDVDRGDNASLAGMINSMLFTDRDFREQAAFENEVMDLDNAAVVEALRKHLDLDAMVYSEAGDFEEEESGDE